MLFACTTLFAEVGNPVSKKYIKFSKCTYTANGTYHAPDGTLVDVGCTKSASSCVQAETDAARCRDLNVCNAVREYGGEPAPALNCPKVDTLEGV